MALFSLASDLRADDECCELGKREVFSASITGTSTGTSTDTIETKNPAFDPATGRDTRNFPPDRAVDFEHMALEILIQDMELPSAQCSQTLRLSPIGAPCASLLLDAKLLTIQSVVCASQFVRTTFTHDGATLTITFEPPLAAGQTAEVTTKYEIRDPQRGMVWTPSTESWPGRAPQIHTQGQPNTNSYWFPCHDFPNERLTTEITAIVPAGFLASANGALAEKTRVIRAIPGVGKSTQLRPFDSFRWVQNKPHVNYLVSLVVGKYDVVDVGDKQLSCPVYVPVGRAGDVQRTYGRTLDMVRTFERRLSEPYPWDRYAQLVAWNFEAGGMENTSATTLHENAVLMEGTEQDFDLDGLIAHELGHQWFGDLLTCNSWEHTWLNEGFAVYMECLWFEQRDGVDGYERRVFEKFDRILEADTGTLPGALAMASKAYEHPWQSFRKPANPYPKGASVLHMLRTMMGDEVFFRALGGYVDQYKFKTVETDQFRRVMEDVSGLQLEQFFAQWVMRPGLPRLGVSWVYDESRRKVRVQIDQKQTIDSENPAFAFSLPVFFKNSAGPDVIVDLPVSMKSESFEVDLEASPTFLAIDPAMTVLARASIVQTEPMHAAQAVSGPSTYARIAGVRALGAAKEPMDSGATATLVRLAGDTTLPVMLRFECVNALGKRADAVALRNIVNASRDDWELREATVAALAAGATGDTLKADTAFARYAGDVAMDRLSRDPSLKVRCAGLKALAKLRDPRAMPAVLEACETQSQSDALRMAAIEAIADMKPEGGLGLLLALAKDGRDPRTRASAAEALPKLSPQGKDLDRALDTLGALLAQTREHRPRMAAARALAELGDSRGLEKLRISLQKSTSPDIARTLKEQVEALEKKIAGGSK